MKSKISCWRFVRSIPSLLAVFTGDFSRPVEHVFGNVARPLDGHKCQPRARPSYTPPARPVRRQPSVSRDPLSILAAPSACGGIGRRARLRALWTNWSVEVRVLSGAPYEARSNLHGTLAPWRFF